MARFSGGTFTGAGRTCSHFSWPRGVKSSESRHVRGGVSEAPRARIGRSDERQKLGRGVRNAPRRHLHALRPVVAVVRRVRRDRVSFVPSEVRLRRRRSRRRSEIRRRGTTTRSDQRDDDDHTARDRGGTVTKRRVFLFSFLFFETAPSSRRYSDVARGPMRRKRNNKNNKNEQKLLFR